MYVLCFTWPRYQVSVYRTIGPLVFSSCQINSIIREHSCKIQYIFVLFQNLTAIAVKDMTELELLLAVGNRNSEKW